MQEISPNGPYIRAYHWSTFGSTDGIYIELPDFPTDSCVMTSMGGRSKIHFVGLDASAFRCKSIVLDITRRITEFTFKEKGSDASRANNARLTAHNCLIDCHAAVWTRFPVAPAVRRKTVVSSANRRPKSLLFVSSQQPSLYQNHFKNLIADFERTTRKPTENELSSIQVSGLRYKSFMKRRVDVSSFKTGEWLVDILCLIPIHIAVTRDNRFIPLKDGVWSSHLERSLLGATVDQIVDSLSFGWYESIFQSYMATKVRLIVHHSLQVSVTSHVY